MADEPAHPTQLHAKFDETRCQLRGRRDERLVVERVPPPPDRVPVRREKCVACGDREGEGAESFECALPLDQAEQREGVCPRVLGGDTGGEIAPHEGLGLDEQGACSSAGSGILRALGEAVQVACLLGDAEGQRDRQLSPARLPGWRDSQNASSASGDGASNPCACRTRASATANGEASSMTVLPIAAFARWRASSTSAV
jgi:hypothetical protein